MANTEEAPVRPRRRPAREAALESPNPVDIAMAAVASGKPMPEVARRVLEEQAGLLHAQRVELRMRHVGELVRAALWAILAVAALAIIVLIGVVLFRAAKSDALIVQSFRVPPTLAARGLTGEVVATQVLDRLAEMQEGTDSVRAASTYANNWEDELKIDIPNTGATTDQVWKVLRGWLGKETRISGEIVETNRGLALTARVGAKAGQRFDSAKGDLDALISQGAELIFKRTQPYRHAVYVGRTAGREIERFGLLMALTADASPIERKWAYSGLSYDRRMFGQFRQAALMADRALAIDPDMVPAIGNKAAAKSLLGHDQEAVELRERSLNIVSGDEYDPAVAAANRCNDYWHLGTSLSDPALLRKSVECAQQSPTSLRDWSDYYKTLFELARGNPGPALNYRPPPGASFTPAEAAGQKTWLNLSAHMRLGPSPELGAAVNAHQAEVARISATDAYLRATAVTSDWPRLADAMSLLGRDAEAAALINKTPTDCYSCLIVRGRIAKRTGNRAAAQQWFLEAAKRGPRLPQAFLDWGRLLIDHRRYESAEVKLRHAARLAPNWSEPLKYWGDLLAARGANEAALRKYDEAVKLAPKWAELHEARQRLLSRQ